MTAPIPAWSVADPFDLPEWLGLGAVTWRATSALGRWRVFGELIGDSSGEADVECDLLAVDEAWPVPVAEPTLRTAAHEAWRRGDVFLIHYAGRLTLPVPGCSLSADDALEAVERLARAVGADPAAYSVSLVAGGHGRSRS